MAKDQMDTDAFNARVNHVQKYDSKQFTRKSVECVDLVRDCGKIYVLKAARARILGWYYRILVHPGKDWMYKTMNAIFTWEIMNIDVKNHCRHCHKCQIAKQTNKKKYGLLPENKGNVVKWS